MSALAPEWIEWSVASRPLAGQSVSGDVSVVKPFRGGVLLAAIDGLGHGEEACLAARTAAAVLNDHAEEPVIGLVRRCHKALAGTRGAVMTVASLQTRDNTLTWIGIGNVEGRLMRAEARANPPKESVLLRGGLVGYQLPALDSSVVPVATGDLLILATDGIHAGFQEEVSGRQRPRQIAESVLGRHFKGTDDALVLVARYLGRPHE